MFQIFAHQLRLSHGGGGGLQPVLMRHPPSYLSKLWGGGGWAGGAVLGGVGWRCGKGGGSAVGGTHYYHMHTSTGDVCLGVWGYRGYVCDNSTFSSLPGRKS